MNSRVKDIIGKKFGKLTVVSFVETKRKHSFWNCSCKCGNEKVIRADSLTTGRATSCGCAPHGPKQKYRVSTRGENKRVYDCWRAMLSRCCDPNNSKSKYYLGKGITVCEEWKKDFVPFYQWSMANGYDDSLTLDRKDSTKGYSPSNCRWATHAEQSQNIRTNVLDPDKVRFIRAEHVKKRTYTSLARELGISREAVRKVALRKSWKNIT